MRGEEKKMKQVEIERIFDNLFWSLFCNGRVPVEEEEEEGDDGGGGRGG